MAFTSQTGTSSPIEMVGAPDLEAAKEYARVAHADQRYGDDRPYTVHLAAVEQVLRRFGETDEALLTAAWLHDVVEDTQTPLSEVRSRFGPRVAELVHAVTNEPGENRKERHLKTYPKVKATPGAVRLKLADRIANVEASLQKGARQLGMYRDELPGFAGALRTPGVEDALWNHLLGLLGKP